jgi:hypothetical protein
MSRILTGWVRPIAPVLLASSLLFCPLVHHEVRAQPPGAPGEEEASAESKGRPLDGYLATISLMLLALFIVGKSARR